MNFDPTDQDIVVNADELREFASQLYQEVGVPKTDANAVAHLQVETDLRGIHSHGTRALPGYVRGILAGNINPTPNLEITRDGPAFARVYGDRALGHVAGKFSMELAIEKAKTAGIGAVGAYTTNHFGAASCLAMLPLEHGMIGFSTSTSSRGVAPYGGKTRVVGNNPFAYAVPAKTEPPIVLDMACGVSAWGRIGTMRLYGKKLEPGWVLDEDGKETDDPNKARVLLPLGGPKGYALALAMDALSGPLTGMGATVNKKGDLPLDKQGSGLFFYALNIESFVPLDEFTEEIDREIHELRSSPPADGFDRVYFPGELEAMKQEQWSADGIPLHRDHLKGLADLATELGVPVFWQG
ncbi:MAG: Ldh family oxidoreductase [Candidatus Poribacteria bacterium]|nr:Ldh family oxidoreductase [Candidatus Poribacteria bacterium]